jgi:hypothetical protein
VADPRLIFGVLQVFLLVLFFAQSPKAVVESGRGFVAPAPESAAWSARSEDPALRLHDADRVVASKRKDPAPEPLARASDEDLVPRRPRFVAHVSAATAPARAPPRLGASPRGPPPA